MKKVIIYLSLFICFQVITYAQTDKTNFTIDNFEYEFLTYKPKSRLASISEKDYDRGLFILQETRRQLEADDMNFSYADFWNITMAFIKLGEPKEHIAIAFQKAINLSEESICEYLEAFGPKSADRLTKAIPETFLPFYEKCGSEKPVKQTLDCKKYAVENGLDETLVTLINEISENDQKYRSDTPVDWSKQTPLDKENLELIDNLYKEYGKYIGKELVGEKLESMMWLVIQHSNIEKMEVYLPVIHKAVQEGDLAKVPLKMLLDRIHCIKFNYQFFGSQFDGDCEIASDKKQSAIREKYGLD